MAESNNKRMAKNTLLMYFRMGVLILVQLYTVPIVLHALGVEDYGIYNVVGGFVMMFTFINGSLVSGCQRFMAYAIGSHDKKGLKDVFDTSFYVFILLGTILFFLIEVVGIWFLNNKMTIPSDRMLAANVVLQFSIISLFVTIVATPFNAAIIAHEQMSVYAYASIFESLYKLLIAFSLTILLMDKLIIYAALIFSSSLLLAFFYILYCRKHFQETRKIRLRKNTELLRDIGSYAGWNVVGSVAIMLRNHGLNVIMNIFFYPVMNAAHTIASHLSGIFNQFVNNVYMATRPQMVKQYAAGNMDEMWNITFKSSKYAYFLMAYVVIPVIIELPSFLYLWLHDVPDYTIIFSRLIILSLLLETTTNQLIGVFQAANKIKYYQSVSSIILLGLVPLSFLVLKLHAHPVAPYILYVIISLAYVISLIAVAYRQVGLDVKSYIGDVLWKDLIVSVPAFLLTLLFVSQFSPSYWRILLTISFSISITSLMIWMIGMDSGERLMIKKQYKKILKIKTERL